MWNGFSVFLEIAQTQVVFLNISLSVKLLSNVVNFIATFLQFRLQYDVDRSDTFVSNFLTDKRLIPTTGRHNIAEFCSCSK
jgi:hypothetical protein